MTKKNESTVAGKVIIYSVSGIPKKGIAYDDFDQIAEHCNANPDDPQDQRYGFPRNYMPQRAATQVQHDQNAWELGTGDFPAKGAIFNPGQAVKDFYFEQYDVEPIFRVRVVRHKKAKDSSVLKRHLYLDVLMATGESDLDDAPTDLTAIDKDSKIKASKAAAKQLTSVPIVLMEFKAVEMPDPTNPAKVIRKGMYRNTVTDDVDARIAPRIEKLIEQMMKKVQDAKDHAQDQSIRAGVRRWLSDNSCFSIRGGSGSGGAYFLPNLEEQTEDGRITRPSTDSKIDGLLCYFDQLGDLLDPDAQKPEVMILDAMRSGSGSIHTARTNNDIMGKAAESIKGRISGVLEEINKITDGKISERNVKNKVDNADMEVMRIFRALNQYREAFDDKFAQLEDLCELVEERLDAVKVPETS